MTESSNLFKARQILKDAKDNPDTIYDRCLKAIDLAALILAESKEIQTNEEKKVQKELSRMMNDPKGRLFITALTDQCFRSQDDKRVANQINYLIDTYGIPYFLSPFKRMQLKLFQYLASWFPALLVPLAKEMIRKATSKVILSGEKVNLFQHLELRKNEGVHINLNHLGEAILGEEEAERRLQLYLEDLANPEIECVSIKISNIYSQIQLVAWEDSLESLTLKLRRLYYAAQNARFLAKDGSFLPKFVYLDMEEYRDLDLTVAAFKKALEQFKHYSAGIVLQSYIPDSFAIQQQLTEWAMRRVAEGGAPIRLRIVKGANLAMEKVEASLKGWNQAPYQDKHEVDANFKRMIIYACQADHNKAVHIGVGSHNLFDICFALLLREETNANLQFEMLEGMADPIQRVVQRLAGEILLYCPAANQEEFQNAIGYLIRRLDENTASQNFLRYLFNLKTNSKEWREQSKLFLESAALVDTLSSVPRRTQNRLIAPQQPSSESPFSNEPDTDWSFENNRLWGQEIFSKWSKIELAPIPLVIGGKEMVKESLANGIDPSFPDKILFKYSLATEVDIEKAIETAKRAEKEWSATPIEQRSSLLAEAAQQLRVKRADLIGAMMANTGKTIVEADVEVSEAIDFAEYYRRNAFEVVTYLSDLHWKPRGTVLVAPPWNFPCSIAASGIIAALMTGNSVIFKPPQEAVLVGWELAKAFWEAGIDKNVLQFIACNDDPQGSKMVKDERINCVILTGATQTAKLFLEMRPDIYLTAETGGKNAIIVTAMADRDLAVKEIVQSAFGHSGQKCSACSLVICEAEVYDSPVFRKQLLDAAKSLKVGSQWDPATRINPLIHYPNRVLLKGLTTLEDNESWLLKPEQDPSNPNLWTPGIKLGVTTHSFTYQNELFGPVLAIMRAEDLDQAIKLANGNAYGLTSGLHSLDEREQQKWQQMIIAGNCYINRGITGAIVQRQPFGGTKESSFGPGMKAGGPNYLMQYMVPQQFSLPSSPVNIEYPKAIKAMEKQLEPSQLTVWHSSISHYLFFWNYYFCLAHDNVNLIGEDNHLLYKPHTHILLRVQEGDTLLDIMRIIAAGTICGNCIEVSGERGGLMSELAVAEWLKEVPRIKVIKETEQQLIERVNKGKVNRARFISQPAKSLQTALAKQSCNTLIAEPLANGRVELVRYLREMVISNSYHRYGYLGEREFNTAENSSCCSNCQCCQGCK